MSSNSQSYCNDKVISAMKSYRDPKVRLMGASFVATMFGVPMVLAIVRLFRQFTIEILLISVTVSTATLLCLWHAIRSPLGYPLCKPPKQAIGDFSETSTNYRARGCAFSYAARKFAVLTCV